MSDEGKPVLERNRRDTMTGKPRGELCTIGQMQDVTDLKVAAIINAHIMPLRERVRALEAPWWRRWAARLRRAA